MSELPPIEAMVVTKDWELTDDVFMKWWSLLAEEDRLEFVHLNRGDTTLARFVCALDFLVMNKIEPNEEKLYQLAYSIAANLPKDDPTLKARSFRAIKEPAFQGLRDRLRHRTVTQNAIRIETKWAAFVEKALDRAMSGVETMEPKELAAVSNMAKEFMQMKNLEESRVRSERTKKAIEKARQAHEKVDDIGPKEAEAYLKAAIKVLSPAKVLELTSVIEQA